MLLFRQFLSVSHRDMLYDEVCKNQMAFEPPGDNDPETSTTFYLPLDDDGTERKGIANIRLASEALSKRIVEILPTMFETLAVKPFEVSEVSLTFINGLDGHNGLPHADSIDGRFKVSFLYYFHRQPKRFRGGDLNIYDKDRDR